MLLLLLVISLSCSGVQASFKAESFGFTDFFATMIRGGSLEAPSPEASRYGGGGCAGCTIVLILVESLADEHQTPVEDEVLTFFISQRTAYCTTDTSS